MKHLYIYLLWLLPLQGYTQLQPSKLGQVFNFEVGDTFQYHYKWTEQQTRYAEGYHTFVVTEAIKSNDTLYYNYAISGFRINFDPGINSVYNFPYPLPLLTNMPPVTIPNSTDSSIFSVFFHGDTCSDIQYCFDSVYMGQLGKYNRYSRRGMNNTDQTYVDSIGLVKRVDYIESYHAGWLQNLVYFHKVNGRTWGAKMFSDVNEIEYAGKLPVYPNPATDYIIVGNNSSHPLNYQITDLTGKVLLTSTDNQIAVNHLPRGVYIVNTLIDKMPVFGRFIKE